MKDTQVLTVSLPAEMGPSSASQFPHPWIYRHGLPKKGVLLTRTAAWLVLRPSEVVLCWLNCVCHLVAASFHGALSSSSSRAQSREFPAPRDTWKVLSEQMYLAFVCRGNPKRALRKAPRPLFWMGSWLGCGLVWRTVELRFWVLWCIEDILAFAEWSMFCLCLELFPPFVMFLTSESQEAVGTLG